MSTPDLVEVETLPAPPPSQPQRVTGVAVTALVVDVVGIALMVFAGLLLRDYNHGGIFSTIVAIILVLGSL
jgi:hypothetical protein